MDWFLIRIDRAPYRWHARKPYYLLRFVGVLSGARPIPALGGVSRGKGIYNSSISCFHNKPFADRSSFASERKIDESSTIQGDPHSSLGLKRFRPPILEPKSPAGALE